MILSILKCRLLCIKVTSGVDFRAKNYESHLENLEKNSIDFYASVKSLYLQDRQKKFLKIIKDY